MTASEASRPDPHGPAPSRQPESREVRRGERQALVMAAMVFLVTLGAWGSAHFACNYREPQFKEPQLLGTSELAENPKDAAIEFQQRWLSGDLSGATELAEEPLRSALGPELDACKAKNLCGVSGVKVLTRGELLRYEGKVALVRTLSQVKGEHTEATLRLEKRDEVWKVLERNSAAPQ